MCIQDRAKTDAARLSLRRQRTEHGTDRGIKRREAADDGRKTTDRLSGAGGIHRRDL